MRSSRTSSCLFKDPLEGSPGAAKQQGTARRHRRLTSSPPVDLLPDFVPFVGQVDDALLAAVVLRHSCTAPDPRSSGNTGGDPASLDRLSRAVGVSLW